MEKICKIGLLVILVFLVVPMVSAATFDNLKSYDDKVGDYGKVTIYNWNIIGKLFDIKLSELELKTNTDECSGSCSAETEIVMHKRGTLIDDVRFLVLRGEEWKKGSIKSYSFKIKTGTEQYSVNDYEYGCVNGLYNIQNNSYNQICSNDIVGNHLETRDTWEDYTLGDEVEAGTYYVKLEGEKHFSKTVDWQISSQGKLISEWATWAGVGTLNNNLVAWYALEDASGNATSSVNTVAMNMEQLGGGTPKYSVPSVVSNGLEFTTSDKSMYVRNTGIMPKGADSRSVSIWVNISTANDDGIIWMGNESVNLKDFGFSSETNKLKFIAYGDDQNIWTTNYVSNQWYHIVLTYDNATNKVTTYVNGTNYVNRTLGGALDTNDILTIARQGYNTGGVLEGGIDEIGIWNRVLKGDEVTGLYNSGSGITWEEPVASVTLNDPPNLNVSGSNTIVFNCSVTATPGNTVDNITLITNQTGGLWISNETIDFSSTGGLKNTTTFTKNIPDGTLGWNCIGYDSASSNAWAITNNTLTIDGTYPIPTITYPGGIIDFASNNSIIYLNWTLTETNPSLCWVDYNNTNTTIPCLDLNRTISLKPNYQNITFYVNDTIGNLNSTSVSWVYKIYNNSETYNTTAYETGTANYKINLTANTSLTAVSLNYNGTSYAATQLGNLWTKNLQVPTGTGKKAIFWEFTYAGDSINTTSNSQTINSANLSLCEGDGGSIPYLNITFKDESDLTVLLNVTADLIDADYWLGDGTVTKNLNTLNATANPRYAFCFTPPSETFTTDMSFKYAMTGYPQRTFVYADTSFTNTTTNKTLYLLSTADGIYSSINTIDSSSQIISGVLVQVEREISGIWTLITQGTTDSSGLVTFWVDPNYIHRITATKTGHTTTQVSITPSQTLYTLTMGASSGAANYNSSIVGITAGVLPGGATLYNGTNTFNVTMFSTNSDLENCKIEIMLTNGTIILTAVSAATNTSYCFAGGSVHIGNPNITRIFARVSVDTILTDGYVVLTSDIAWLLSFGSADLVKGWRKISGIFTELKDWQDFGTGSDAEFSRMIFFFLITTILIGVFTFFSGSELASPGIILWLFYFVMILASIAGFFALDINHDGITTGLENWVMVIMMGFWVAGNTIHIVRRGSR